MSKGDIMEMVYTKDELRNVDCAIPIDVANELRNYGLSTRFFVMDYNQNRMGRLVNLGERFVEKFVAEQELRRSISIVPSEWDQNFYSLKANGQ